MEPLLVAESPIDNEIATIRAQIEALRHRRSLLYHTLLSSRKLKSQLARTKPTATLSRDSIASAQDLVSEHENTTIANLHRTCAGITAFRVQDPDPNAVDSGNVLGIRFEIFSGKDRAFQTPYYVLLNQPTPNSGHLKVHKHTIPVFIPLQALAKKYLPFNIQDEDNDSGSVKQCPAQDLPKFVRALRKEVVAHHKRIDAYERIQRALGRYPGVGEANMLDATGKEIEILFTNGAVARLRIATDGKVEKVAVGAAPKASSEKALPDLDMKTFREIKKAIEGGDGRIDDLAVRLRSRTKR